METTQRLEELQSRIDDFTEDLRQHEVGQATLTPSQRSAVNNCLTHVRSVATYYSAPMEAAIVQVATEILLRQATAEMVLIKAKARVH